MSKAFQLQLLMAKNLCSVNYSAIYPSHTQLFHQDYGTASFPGIPMTPSILLYAGSTTKTFAAAVMKMIVEDNKNYPQVQWDMLIQQLILDDFA